MATNVSVLLYQFCTTFTNNPVLVMFDLSQIYFFIILELVVAHEARLRRVPHTFAGFNECLEVHELMSRHQFIFTGHIIITLFLSL